MNPLEQANKFADIYLEMVERQQNAADKPISTAQRNNIRQTFTHGFIAAANYNQGITLDEYRELIRPNPTIVMGSKKIIAPR